MPIHESIPHTSIESDAKTFERLVEKRWNDQMTTRPDIVSSIAKIRENIRVLQMPGEIFIQAETRESQEYVPLSPDEQRGDFHYDSRRTNHCLVVGARKPERIDGLFHGDFGGKRFLIASYESGRYGGGGAESESAEAHRQALLAMWQKDLHGLVRGSLWEPGGLSEEQLRKYTAAREAFIQTLEAKWKQEDDQILAEHLGDHQRYEATATRVRAARVMVEAVKAELRRYRLSTPDVTLGNIGNDSLEELEACEKDLLAYVAKAKALIAQYLEDLDAVTFATAEERDRAMKAEPVPAPWFLYGVKPEALEKFGPQRGEGFGKRVIGGSLVFLPGSKPVVGFHIDGKGRRYKREISYTGLASLQHGRPEDLPGNGSRDAIDILAIVKSPDWSIRWIQIYEGAPECYGLADVRGIGALWLSGSEVRGRVHTVGWGQPTDTDIPLEDICKAHGLSVPISHTSRADIAPVLSAVPSDQSLGVGALASAFERVGTGGRERPVTSTAKPNVARPEPKLEQNIQPTEAREILLRAHDDLVLIHAIFRGIPVRSYDAPRTKQESEALEKAAAAVKAKRAEIFITFTEMRTFLETAQIHTVKDRDSMFGKIAALKKSVERLANSKEALLLIGKSVSKDWLSSWMELWNGLPTTVNDGVSGMVSEKDIPSILREVQKQVALLVGDFQQGKDLKMKKIIEGIAVAYIE